MVVIAIRTQKNDPAALRNELVAARTRYNDARNSVLDRVQTRHAVVTETISDLEAEQRELVSLAQDAQS